MEKEQILLAQVRMYLSLAKGLKSSYYLHRAKQTLEMYFEYRQERTIILAA